MKALHSPLSRSKFFTKLFLWCLPVFIFSCTAVGVKESPMRFGYGVAIAPGLQLGDSKASAHVLLAYQRIPFEGGGGHNNFWQAGGQFRWSFADKPNDGSFWTGAEVSYLGIYSNNSSVKQTASGFTAGGLAGYRFLVAKVPVSFYAAPAYLSRGKFKTNGMTSGSSSSGFICRIGFDIHFASLLGKKGR